MAIPGGRIPELALKVTAAVLYALAISAAICRSVIHVRLSQRLELDDGFLLTACICLTAATVFLFIFMSGAYVHQLGQDPNLASSRIDMGEKIDWSIDMGNTYLVLSQTVIFSIKASFLSFFRRLIDRLGRIIIYWKVTVTVTVIAFFFCASQAFISCPETGLNKIICSSKERISHRTIPNSVVSLLLNIGTDIMIVAIPIWVLWKVQMKRRQKLGLGLLLCSSVLLVIVAGLTLYGLNYHGTIDITWTTFGTQLQTTTAVMAFSFTAFRSLFTTEKLKFGARGIKARYSPPVRLLRRTRTNTWYGGNQRILQSFPSATLTGMRTIIRAGTNTRASTLDTETGIELHGGIPLQDLRQITVTHDLSCEVQVDHGNLGDFDSG